MSKWGVFESFDEDEIHIVPCDDSDQIVGGHIPRGLACHCGAHRDDAYPTVIIHEDRERGGYNA